MRKGNLLLKVEEKSAQTHRNPSQGCELELISTNLSMLRVSEYSERICFVKEWGGNS